MGGKLNRLAIYIGEVYWQLLCKKNTIKPILESYIESVKSDMRSLSSRYKALKCGLKCGTGNNSIKSREHATAYRWLTKASCLIFVFARKQIIYDSIDI